MLTVDQAQKLVLEHAGRQPVADTSLEEACGRVLAEEIASDLDSPPFAKALMDGFAVRNEDMASGSNNLKLIGELAAGATATEPVQPGTTYQIMTGAPMPAGADAVVIVERSKLDGGSVHLADSDFRPGQNVMPRARELAKDEIVLRPGHVLGPAEVGLLATVGRTRVKVYRQPTVAVLSTGDEIVPPEAQPGPGQIRNSNASTVCAMARTAGAEVVNLGIAPDEADVLSARVFQGLGCDVLILSGGVSAGKRDLVPGVLADRGVSQVFHKVALKPGKPVWFGKHDNGLVFGLPGNPVSVLVCFKLFVETTLRRREQHPQSLPAYVTARLAEDFSQPAKRETFHPAWLSDDGRGPVVKPVDWFGSPDLKALTAANALLVCPVSDEPTYSKDALMRVLPLR